ncbi:pyridoxamine 5'-phosphate oxidase family protein [Caenimonas sedimenti]|uniref:Pyridoxamine 5'-phosphate oxidase family protein n=1 Tax=Caenimonas sedimenti TaxID=2596921 RepID=A0A562ZN43_9BURK|nr:pyridoxamine 5'-phosphate oxidase family protein [Caenimonas sedimenti]TWO69837.1 pyridoxamine 5'-phosphate oxidase family protein [Caenimonas sedimenti]
MDEKKPSHETLWELIKDTRFCMLAHRHTDGSLHSHPLTTQNKALDEGGSLYFFVSKKTELGQRLQSDGNVNLAYANPGKDTWVSITGTARVLEDMAKKKELFNVIAKAWFPGGAEDPDLELVEVVIDEAEYWNVKENKLLQLIKMATAAATGNKPKKMGEHAELNFNN